MLSFTGAPGLTKKGITGEMADGKQNTDQINERKELSSKEEEPQSTEDFMKKIKEYHQELKNSSSSEKEETKFSMTMRQRLIWTT